jgi:hypothetical protein
MPQVALGLPAVFSIVRFELNNMIIMDKYLVSQIVFVCTTISLGLFLVMNLPQGSVLQLSCASLFSAIIGYVASKRWRDPRTKEWR